MNALELLSRSERIALVLPASPEDAHKRQAAFFTCGLQKLGKSVVSEPTAEKTFVVSLKGLASRVAKVRYEKDEADLRLYFTLNEGDVSPDALSMEAMRAQGQADLVIIVGKQAKESNSASRVPRVAEAEAKQALFSLLSFHSDPQARTLGAALATLEYAPRLNLYVALLSADDLLLARAESKLLPGAVADLKEAFGTQSSYLALFDSAAGAQGVLWSPSARLVNSFRGFASTQQKGPWVLLLPTPLPAEQLKHAFLSSQSH